MQVSKVIVAATMGLMLGAAHAQTADQMSKAIAAGARFAGTNARVATDLCQMKKDQVDAYKNSSKQAFAQDSNFEADWQAGWQKGQATVTQYTQLKTRNPSEYAQQKSATCSELAEQLKS